MIRKNLTERGFAREEHFRWRGSEVTRIEGLSDAVFAFAVTLLVVSLEVPKTFGELLRIMQGFAAFALSFSLLILVWYNHFLFFRRYGLQDKPTLILNAALLFVVLFYIYPLKFLFSLLINMIFGLGGQAPEGSAITGAQTPVLMTIYSLGFFSIFLIFFLLHGHAYRMRRELELSPVETLLTRMELYGHGVYMSVALLSTAIAQIGGPGAVAWAGWAYVLIGPVRTALGVATGRRLKRLLKAS